MTDTTHIVISKTLHALLKRYCRDRGLVMQKLVDDIIEEFLDGTYDRLRRKALSEPSGGEKCQDATTDIPLDDLA